MAVTPEGVLCVCVKTSDNKEAFFFNFRTCRGAGHHMKVPAQRRGSHVDAEEVWNARLCTCNLYRAVVREVRQGLKKLRELPTSGGVTPSKELCKGVCVCARARAYACVRVVCFLHSPFWHSQAFDIPQPHMGAS